MLSLNENSDEAPPFEFPYMYVYARDKLQFYISNIKNKTYFIKKNNNRIQTSKFSTNEIDLIKDPASYEEADAITNLFTEYVRMRSRINKHLSPYEYWRRNYPSVVFFASKEYGLNPSHIPLNLKDINVMSHLESKKSKEAIYCLHEAMYRLCKETTTFSPVLSAYIYDKFLPERGGNVFDPFGGWGDRMIGAICCKKVKKYVCVDANLNLKKGYEAIKKTIPGGNKVYYTIMDTLKYLPGDRNLYDLIFTSPPYFDYEIYTTYQDPMQSIYLRDYAKWIKEFYNPIFTGCLRLCKEGGYMIIHVGNTSSCPTLVEDTKKIVNGLGAKLINTLNVRTGDRRPIPIFVYKKI